jgi:hypothetical protein
MPVDKNVIPMKMSGYCQHPSTDQEEFDSHEYCQIREFPCNCECHRG